jgi:hypothetical protein
MPEDERKSLLRKDTAPTTVSVSGEKRYINGNSQKKEQRPTDKNVKQVSFSVPILSHKQQLIGVSIIAIIAFYLLYSSIPVDQSGLYKQASTAAGIPTLTYNITTNMFDSFSGSETYYASNITGNTISINNMTGGNFSGGKYQGGKTGSKPYYTAKLDLYYKIAENTTK